MSTPVKDRRRSVIGCNIKPGHTPGGFIAPYRKRKEAGAEHIKAVANQVLAAHGFVPAPSLFERSVVPVRGAKTQ